MKTRSTRSLRRLLFKIRFFCDYAAPLGQLERALARKPEKFQLHSNGRTSYMIAATFLELNGREFTATEESAVEMPVALAKAKRKQSAYAE